MPVAAEPRVLFTGEFEALIVALSSGDLQPVAKAVDQPRLICSVREADAAAELGRCLKGASPVVVDPPHGLSLEVDAPESVGSDRLFAVRGALEHRPQNWIVVQVGTALTVDAVRWTGEQGAFLGGAIAPGPRLLSEALHAGGARLPLVDPQPNVPATGGNTERALAAGIAIGLGGAAQALVREIAREAGWPAAPVMLTGGARGFVRAALGEGSGALHEEEHLVARGMAAGYGA